MTKGHRVRYSRWDGTQVGFELDADDVFGEITDDLLYHGDLNAALRRMMQSGFRDRNGERIQGIREMLEKLRRKRRDELERYDLGGVYDDIAAGAARRRRHGAPRRSTSWPTRRAKPVSRATAASRS